MFGLMVLLNTEESLGQVNANKTMLSHVIIDTVNVSNTSISIRVLWLNDTLRIRVSNGVESSMDSLVADIGRRNKKIGLRIGRKQKVEMSKYIKTSFQNCFSYAMEKYFRENDSYEQNLFNENIWLEAGVEELFKNAFVRKTSFHAKPRRNLRRFIPAKSILILRDKSKMFVHALYYNHGIFYSKNGVFKPKEYTSLKDVFKESYNDTYDIVVYKFEE